MRELLEMANRREHRQDRLDQHSAVPLAALAHPQVLRMPVNLLKAFITEHDHLLSDAVDQMSELGAVVDIGESQVPVDNEAEMIDQIANLGTHNPTPVRLTLPPDLVGTASLADRVDQLDTIAVDDAQQRRVSQKALRPPTMTVEQAKQSRALRQLREQRSIVARQPAVEGAAADPFQGKQQAQRHHFARIQLRLAVLAYILHLIIYPTEQLSDKINRSHEVPLSLFGLHLTESGNFVFMSN